MCGKVTVLNDYGWHNMCVCVPKKNIILAKHPKKIHPILQHIYVYLHILTSFPPLSFYFFVFHFNPSTNMQRRSSNNHIIVQRIYMVMRRVKIYELEPFWHLLFFLPFFPFLLDIDDVLFFFRVYVAVR